MKFRQINKWKNKQQIKGLLFFAQRVDEMLFDFSISSYKAPALNTLSLCREALTIIHNIKDSVIDINNLEPVLEELKDSLYKDKVAKKLISLDIDQYIPETSISNIDECALRLSLLTKEINVKDYHAKTKSLLRDAIQHEKKTDINNLAISFITTMVIIGYHPRYIYRQNLQYFYYDKNKPITVSSDIDGFFDLFSGNDLEYTVVTNASSLFKETKEACKPFKSHLRCV